MRAVSGAFIYFRRFCTLTVYRIVKRQPSLYKGYIIGRLVITIYLISILRFSRLLYLTETIYLRVLLASIIYTYLNSSSIILKDSIFSFILLEYKYSIA